MVSSEPDEKSNHERLVSVGMYPFTPSTGSGRTDKVLIYKMIMGLQYLVTCSKTDTQDCLITVINTEKSAAGSRPKKNGGSPYRASAVPFVVL
jgi:hypothetical protein